MQSNPCVCVCVCVLLLIISRVIKDHWSIFWGHYESLWIIFGYNLVRRWLFWVVLDFFLDCCGSFWVFLWIFFGMISVIVDLRRSFLLLRVIVGCCRFFFKIVVACCCIVGGFFGLLWMVVDFFRLLCVVVDLVSKIRSLIYLINFFG